MTIQDFLSNNDLEHALILGYYGGGNFGDELLLEVLQNQFKSRGIERATFMYSNPERYSRYHHDFGYQSVTKAQLPQALISAGSVTIGGGGLWGLDANLGTLFLGMLLFLAHFGLGKRVYLIGVGYYDSTNRLGRISAWLAAKAARLVIARDPESCANFSAAGAQAYLDDDIAFLVRDMNLSAYEVEAQRLADQLKIDSPATYVALRHFRAHTGFDEAVQKTVQAHPHTRFIVSLLQPATQYPAGDLRLRGLSRLPNVDYLNADVNPLALTLFFQQHSRLLTFITPQFHSLVVALIFDIPFAPIAYDNKVRQLLERHGVTNITPINALTSNDLSSLNLSDPEV
jgi:polysaccharide pyruvyl transferase WcaK-like protein